MPQYQEVHSSCAVQSSYMHLSLCTGFLIGQSNILMDNNLTDNVWCSMYAPEQTGLMRFFGIGRYADMQSQL